MHFGSAAVSLHASMQPWRKVMLTDKCRLPCTAVKGAGQEQGPVLLPRISASTSVAALHVPRGSPDQAPCESHG